MRPARRPAVAAAVVLAATLTTSLGLAGCSVVRDVVGADDTPEPQEAVVAPSDAPVPVASDARFAAQGVDNFLTGEDVPNGPVLAVKVDNTSASLPQVGLNEADVVYFEEVEGGSTRLLVVFQTQVPARVGPVRSGRTSDVNILGNYGPVALAFAGANSGVRQELAATELQLVSLQAGGEGFRRVPDRRAPYDVIGDGRVLLERAPAAGIARDIGFRFGEPPAGGRPASQASYSWPASTAEFRWSSQADAWVQHRGGEPALDDEGAPMLADNVVFMDADVVPTRYVDVNGARSPEVRPIGEGEVTVLRDGQAFDGTWTRESLEAPTRFRDASGADLLLDTGSTWVVLMRRGGAPTIAP